MRHAADAELRDLGRPLGVVHVQEDVVDGAGARGLGGQGFRGGLAADLF